MTRPSILTGLALVSTFALAWATGCGDSVSPDSAAAPEEGSSEQNPNFGTDPNRPPTPDGGSAASPADFCGGAGIPVPGTNSCVGDLAPNFFRFAACSCTTLAISGKIRTVSMNSTDGTTNEQAASIAANKNLALSGKGTVGGSTFGAGIDMGDNPSPVVYSGNTTVRHDSWSGGNVVVNGNHTVEGDAYIEGAVFGGSFSVKGKTEKPASFPAPCDCARKLDIAAMIEPYKTQNDNALIGLGDDALANGGELTLPCGRYHLTKIEKEVTLNLKGRTAIFVDENVAITGGMTIHLDPGAELDLFVAGDFALSGSAAFGSLETPSKVRVYTAKNFALSGVAEIGGNIYAPNAAIALSSLFKMSGSMFANLMAFSGGFDVTYDESILDVKGCAVPGSSCSSCNDCPGASPACSGGTCGACSSNADCCAPLKCSKGACVADIR